MVIEQFIRLARTPARQDKNNDKKLIQSVSVLVAQDLPEIEKQLAEKGYSELAGEVERQRNRLDSFLSKIRELTDESMQVANYRKAAEIISALLELLLTRRKEEGLETIEALERAAGNLGFYKNLGINADSK